MTPPQTICSRFRICMSASLPNLHKAARGFPLMNSIRSSWVQPRTVKHAGKRIRRFFGRAHAALPPRNDFVDKRVYRTKGTIDLNMSSRESYPVTPEASISPISLIASSDSLFGFG